MVDVVLAGLGGRVAHLANVRPRLHGHVVGAKEDDVLDLLLQLVGQLEPLAVENFFAIRSGLGPPATNNETKMKI